ncbi:nicotinamide/nicotinic acid mononucleotide adenylyltransferase 1 [Gigaspora margarita]|uniref:Nicotinamide/nicotinic acid mononucleotide adenylyltransferase 1 n=1 Tax=Gigaspora margarita TaxID=4874 RepID=A0A8H3XJE8_GIGMA|nr:nicotinamide/nicotinic acid mononucleotide adenylyltransferase 1 [Gigaspora margarita]
MNLQENDFIPINKLLKNLENESEQPQVILLTCGSYNPIHNLHIQIFEHAKQYLEEEKKYNIVLGYISPSQDIYVNQKYHKQAILLEDRKEMIKLAIKDSSWIDITTWESLSQENAKDIIDYYLVVKNLSRFFEKNEQVRQALKGRPLKIVYLCGLDQVTKKERKGLRGLEGYEIVIIERYLNDTNEKKDLEYCKEKLKKMYTKDKWKLLENQIIFINCKDNNEISSKKIRKSLKDKDNDDWENMCHPDVVDYIKKNKILDS